MSCFRGQRGLAESQKKELVQTPVLISCADQWNSAAAAAMKSHNLDIGSGAFTLLSGKPTLKGDLNRKLWTRLHLPPCGEFAWAWVHGGGERASLPPPCSSLSQCFSWSLSLVWGRMPFRSPLLSPPPNPPSFLSPFRCSVRACGRTKLSPSAWVPL